MPAYVKLCLKTWEIQPYVLLNYQNLNDYTDLDISKLRKFTLPQVADIVRVHVLRDQGGVWMDADTIITWTGIPETNMIGYPELRDAHIGFLKTSEETVEMFKQWAAYQDEIINSNSALLDWDIVGNRFSDKYIKENPKITIGHAPKRCPEVLMINENIPKKDKYRKFYFESSYELKDIAPTDILMLHNSWTPEFYKWMSEKDVINNGCTMSNILREVLV